MASVASFRKKASSDQRPTVRIRGGPDAQLDGSAFLTAAFELELVVALELVELVGACELVAGDGHGEIGKDCTSTADPR